MESGRVAAHERRKLYVANLRGGITADDLASQFKRFGIVTEAHILNRMGRGGRLSGFVTFADCGSAQQAVEELRDWCPDGDGEKVTIKLADVKGAADEDPEKAKQRQPPYKLYVSNLPPMSTVEYITEIFELYGQISNCYMLFTRGRGNRKSCFITFEEQQSAIDALNALSDQLFDDDQRLTVRWADPPKKQQEPTANGTSDHAKSTPASQANASGGRKGLQLPTPQLQAAPQQVFPPQQLPHPTTIIASGGFRQAAGQAAQPQMAQVANPQAAHHQPDAKAAGLPYGFNAVRPTSIIAGGSGNAMLQGMGVGGISPMQNLAMGGTPAGLPGIPQMAGMPTMPGMDGLNTMNGAMNPFMALNLQQQHPQHQNYQPGFPTPLGSQPAAAAAASQAANTTAASTTATTATATATAVPQAGGASGEPVKLLVNNLDPSWDEETIKSMFVNMGEVVDVTIIPEVNGLRTGIVAVKEASGQANLWAQQAGAAAQYPAQPGAAAGGEAAKLSANAALAAAHMGGVNGAAQPGAAAAAAQKQDPAIGINVGAMGGMAMGLPQMPGGLMGAGGIVGMQAGMTGMPEQPAAANLSTSNSSAHPTAAASTPTAKGFI